ncbi:MAG: D-glycero-beta-D-manno-heptose 1,7-bisphosphate 7-phosphatase [Gammaproteobacteria bacterium]|nr:D-glycero-beta-D-manno-heptose 1,7-bisphosphate 7-phosphatase [Gammaproteobacteria bacterium]MBU2546630.1 D-glycero-beta-D-manno-heptose 1,7-bisphosphate 7-phosphatase [Gammaproteobacteria bacterium]
MNKISQKPIVLLDRDGVINEDSDAYIKSPEEWHAIPGSMEAIAKLHKAGFLVIVVSNQSGVGRGYFDLSTLEKIHQKMLKKAKQAGGKIDAIYFCPHTPDDHCECRKPKVGLLKKVEADYQVDLKDTVLIGDALRDIQAGEKVGATCFLVKTGKGKRTLAEHPELTKRLKVFDDLSKAVDSIV